MIRLLTGLLSLVVPGLGQLLRGAWVDALLWLAASAWTHAVLSGTAWLGGPAVDPFEATLLGALAHPPARRFPLVVVLTVLAFALHVGAALDVGVPRKYETPGSVKERGGSYW
ncbi:MAG: hypothetical protein ACQEXJ_08220 [Myxococcota bacterium]